MKIIKTISKSAVRNAELTCPLGAALRSALIGVEFATASIIGLFFLGGPFAVSGFVVAVCVYTIDRMQQCRRFAHIGQEVFKHPPSITDSDTPAAVAEIHRIVGICAAGTHTTPRIMDFSMAHAVSEITLRQSFTAASPMKTPTAFSVAIIKALCCYSHDLSAFTGASPPSMTAICPAILGDRQAVKYAARQINKVRLFWKLQGGSIAYGC